jgi:hypothetical protein
VLAKYDQFSPIYDHRLNLGRVELVVVFSILIRLNLERSLHIVEDFSHLLMLILVFFFLFLNRLNFINVQFLNKKYKELLKTYIKGKVMKTL